MSNLLKFSECNRIRLKLLLLSLDWVLDIGTTVSHFSKGRWVEGTLTYLIVFGSGCIITIGFLRYPDIRKEMSQGAKDAGLLFRLLLYIPTFFTLVSAKLWLNSLRFTSNLPLDAKNEDREKAQNQEQKYKDWAIKSFWTETVFEAKPQALLQTLFLLETNNRSFTNPLDFLPILLAIWSVHSITSSIYDFVISNYEDKTPITSRLYGISYTVLSILSPVLVMNVTRSRMSSAHGKFFGTLLSLLVYYIMFEIIYQLTYLTTVTVLSRKDKQRGNYDSQLETDTSKATTIELNMKSLEQSSRRFSKMYQLVLSTFFIVTATTWIFMSYKHRKASYSSSSEFRRKIVVIICLVFASLCLNLLSYFTARNFVTEVYRLKNAKIAENWFKLRLCRVLLHQNNT